jgi:HEAT repeat protein
VFSPLAMIWIASLVLVLLAVAALATLILARLVREREERADPDRRARISNSLLRYAAAVGEPPVLAIDNRIERQAVVETALHAIPIMRGPAKVRLVELLRGIGLAQRLRRQALRGSMRDRLLALEGLSLFRDAETIATLNRAEQARDLRIWMTALRTRAEIGPGPDVAELLKLVDRPGARRAPVMHDLLAARVQKDLPGALCALRGELPGVTRALLIRAIGETREAQALDPLRFALRDLNPAVRSAAAGALGELGFDAAADALAQATCDDDWRVRLKASEAIGRLGLWRRADCLEPLLDDPVWWVRFRAEEALKRLSPPSRQEPVAATAGAKAQRRVVSAPRGRRR